VYTGGGVMVNSGFLDGLPAIEARRKAIEWLDARGLGRATVHYRVPDWGISGPHDAGVPIPIIACPRCGMVPEKLENLPLTEAPLGLDVPCPRCGGPGRRETETMEPAFEASWHFHGAELPVDQYVCGGEHAALHLLHARFSTKALRDVGLVEVDEPFRDVVMPESVVDDGRTSPSADAAALIATYGADTVRLFSLFAAPPDKRLEWTERGMEAASRFVSRLWRFVDAHRAEMTATPPGEPAAPSPRGRAFRRVVDETILRVTRDVDDRFRFNTAISAIHELVNALHAVASGPDPLPQPERQRLLREGTETALLLLAPVVPHVVEELWEQLGHTRSIFHASWPTADPAALEPEVVPIMVQVDGRLRSQLAVPPELAKDDLIAQALADDKVRPWLEAREVVRIVVVPGRLVNVVTRAPS
jgi:leucyl-tRNA synthetase